MLVIFLILDADKEGFLRSETSLIQTMGRAARNVEQELKIESSGLSQLYESGRKKGVKIPKSERESIIKELKKKMLEAAKNLEFEEAAKIRDEIAQIKAM